MNKEEGPEEEKERNFRRSMSEFYVVSFVCFYLHLSLHVLLLLLISDLRCENNSSFYFSGSSSSSSSGKGGGASGNSPGQDWSGRGASGIPQETTGKSGVRVGSRRGRTVKGGARVGLPRDRTGKGGISPGHDWEGRGSSTCVAKSLDGWEENYTETRSDTDKETPTDTDTLKTDQVDELPPEEEKDLLHLLKISSSSMCHRVS